MKVLHIFSHDSPRLAIYVRQLMRVMPDGVECAFADNAADMSRACSDFHPDIIHQHGKAIGHVTGEARLVVSPHGETVDNSRAYVVLARSPYELSCCKTERKELVRNPLITKTITFDEAAASIAAVYRRVMDSNPLELMDAETRHMLAVLLKAGILNDSGWVDTEDYGKPFDFRHLFIYSSLEGVLPIVLRGIDLLSIETPEVPPVDCYLPCGYQTPKPMPVSDVTELLEDINRNGVTLLRLTELTKALHNDSLDEAALMQQAETRKLLPLLQSVLQLLSEQTLLTEGFMPCPPVENALTQKLRASIDNHLRLIPNVI